MCSLLSRYDLCIRLRHPEIARIWKVIFSFFLISKWFQSDSGISQKVILEVGVQSQSDFKVIWHKVPKVISKVILNVVSKWFQLQNGAKLLPDDIFLKNSSKKWFWKWFQSDLSCKNVQNCFQRRCSCQIHPKSDFKVILKVLSKWF